MLKPTVPSPSIHLTHCGRVGVAQVLNEFSVIAAVPIRPGELVFQIEGVQVPVASRFSVQVDDQWHVDLSKDATEKDIILYHPWRFMNHSCDPSVRVIGREVRALRAILPGDEITFDYDTTEFEMAEPFDCRCGAAACRGWIGGFAHLDPAHHEVLREMLAPHLLTRVEQMDGASTKA